MTPAFGPYNKSRVVTPADTSLLLYRIPISLHSMKASTAEAGQVLLDISKHRERQWRQDGGPTKTAVIEFFIQIRRHTPVL